MVRDLLMIIVGERRAILRGLIIAFCLVLPFTFLPAILKRGFTVDVIAAHASVSVVYTFSFALLVVIVAILYNYKGLADRKWYFDRPAFRNLDFQGRVDGADSVVCDLETLLLGQVRGYYFRLSLVGTDTENARLEIIPAIVLDGKEAEIKVLLAEYGFSHHRFFGKILSLNEVDLEDEDSIHTKLEYYASVLRSFGFEPIPFDGESSGS
ncbi:MAG TPA: hypothetical protein VGK59_17470 [Ohtaekwangia sp.]